MLTRHIWEYLQVTPGPFPDFWVGPGDEARSRLAGRIKCVACETKSGASVKEYMSSVASLLWVWLARLVHVSFQTFALYLSGSPGVR